MYGPRQDGDTYTAWRRSLWSYFPPVLLRYSAANGCAIASGVPTGSVSILFRKGWHCQFLEEDMKTQLPRTLAFAEDRKIWEMAKRGGFTLNIAGRQEIEEALRKGVGGIWLDLTREQYAKLRQL